MIRVSVLPRVVSFAKASVEVKAKSSRSDEQVLFTQCRRPLHAYRVIDSFQVWSDY